MAAKSLKKLISEAKEQWDAFDLVDTQDARNQQRNLSLSALQKLEMPPWAWVAIRKAAEEMNDPLPDDEMERG